MRRSEGKRRARRKQVATIFTVAVAANYLWEMGQMFYYAGMDSPGAAWNCLLASLGDGLLVLLIFASGWIVLRRRSWYERPGVGGYLLMLIAGFVIGITVESVAVRVSGTWKYTSGMPLLPGTEMGLLPVAQMLMLPPVIFRLVSAWVKDS
jgi:hypothetical protein